MPTLSFISPKSILVRIADMFQIKEGFAPGAESKVRTLSDNQESHTSAQTISKPKLSVSLDDLKVISTALLHYKRNLAKVGEMEKAESVGKIDKQFYELILDMEAKMSDIEAPVKAAA